MIVAAVLLLVFVCAPLAIIRRITQRIINPVQGMTGRWARPHIRYEVLERIAPAVANRNASPSVVWKSAHVGVIAAHFHLIPNAVFRALLQSMRAMGTWFPDTKEAISADDRAKAARLNSRFFFSLAEFAGNNDSCHAGRDLQSR